MPAPRAGVISRRGLCSLMKFEPGPPATFGSTATAHVWLVVWSKDCRHQVEPGPVEMATRYGPETTMLDCGRYRRRR